MTINNRLRTEFLNTQVITRTTGKRLGVVREILVDVDRREVVALGLRDNRLALSGLPRYMYLHHIRQTGDVVLVEDEEVIEDINLDVFSPLINSEVVTETGEPLGKVRDFQFNPEDGRVSSIIIASIGLPQIPEQFISTYELSMEEVISSGPNRLVVFEGAEERLNQLSVGLIERLGFGRPPWEKEEDSYYPQVAKPENQLGTGIPVRTPVSSKPVELKTPVVENNWNDDDWEEKPMQAPPKRQAEVLRYEEDEDDEEDNWSQRAQPRKSQSYNTPPAKNGYDDQEYENRDVWDDDVEPETYTPPRINIPQKQKAPEYEDG